MTIDLDTLKAALCIALLLLAFGVKANLTDEQKRDRDTKADS